MSEKVIKILKKYRYLIIFFTISIVIVALIILKYNNPEKTNIFPPCLVYKFTGIKCAGCGMTRAVHYLLNFEIKKAFVFNPLLFVYIIYFLYLALKYIILKKSGKRINQNYYIMSLYIILIVTVLFMIFRNILNI